MGALIKEVLVLNMTLEQVDFWHDETEIARADINYFSFLGSLI